MTTMATTEATAVADPREARFLASQAERRLLLIASANNNSKNNQHHHQDNHHDDDDDDDASGLADEANNNISHGDIGALGSGSSGTTKEQSHLFWKNFRSLCSQFQNQINSLLLLLPTIPSSDESSTSSSDQGITISNNNNENAKAYYATASRRNEGRAKLDSILRNVRSLQRHALSSSSSVVQLALSSSASASVAPISNSNQENNNDSSSDAELLLLLQSILKLPMPEVTQTDVRLLSQEIDGILKRIEKAREIVCPKEKFVFERYRRAVMEEEERKKEGLLGAVGNANGNVVDRDVSIIASKETPAVSDAEVESSENGQSNCYGGVLENKSDCTIEISSDGTMLVNETTEEQLKYYSAPHHSHSTRNKSMVAQPPQQQQHSHSTSSQQESSSSSSYLLLNLQNVTLIVHGARPSLHMKHIRNCKIHIVEPTAGPVHVTDCRDSEIRCSCYQLRIHDSKDVTFNVWTRSGPIIEDCQGMVFRGNYYADNHRDDGTAKKKVGSTDGSGNGNCTAGAGLVGRNMFWDVKDFNWLRALRKSPNFVVIAQSAAENDNERGGGKGGDVAGNAAPVVPDCDGPAMPAEDEEDSEDEL